MEEYNWERVKEPDDPRRCQANDANGQCMIVHCEGSEYCSRHGGIRGIERAVKAENRMYKLGKWRAAVSRFQDHDQLKSLREEIGIMRMMIDEKLSLCQDAQDLLMASGPLGDMIAKVNKLVLDCNKIETHLAGVLDKTQALQLGQEMVEIIGRHLDMAPDKDAIIKKLNADVDPDTLELVQNALADFKSKDDILEGVSNDIIISIERLGKTS